MALTSSAGIKRYGQNDNGKSTATNTGVVGPQVKPLPLPPNPFAPQAPQQVMGKVTQKNGKYYGEDGQEAVFKNNQWQSAQQPQQNAGGFNFSFGGGGGSNLGGSMAAGGYMGGQTTAPKGTGGVGQTKGGYDGSGYAGGQTRPGGSGGFTNATQNDPNIKKATDAMYASYAQQAAQANQLDPFQQESIANLRRQQGTDQTQRATNQATSAIRDFGAGQQEAANVRKAQMGQGGGASGQIAQSAQRAQAKAAADIQMGEQGRQDQLALGGASILNAPSQLGLARQGQANGVLGSLYGGANMQGNLALGQQGLGLEAWKAQNDPKYDKDFQSQLMQQQLAQGQMGLQGQQLGLYGDYLKLLQGSGYGGYGAGY